MRVSGKQNLLFPLGSVIKCLLIFDQISRTSAIRNICKKYMENSNRTYMLTLNWGLK